MSFKQSHEMEGTLKECLTAIAHALGGHDYEVTGDQVVVRDAGRRLVIHLVYEGDRKLGSLELPMVRVDYDFVGYTAEEADDFMKHLSQHLMRIGGG